MAMRPHVGPIADLVRAARAGDLDAWAAVVDDFQGVAVGLVGGWTGDWTIAEDVAQDAFVTAFEHLDELVDPQAFPAWFTRIVRSAMTRHLRRERRASLVSDRDDPAVVDPAEVVVTDDESSRLRTAVESLPEHERAVIALHYLGGLLYPQVGELLGIGVSAAKKRAASGRRHLKALLPAPLDALRSARRLPTPRL